MNFVSPSETLGLEEIRNLYGLLEHVLLNTGLPKEPSAQIIERQGADLVSAFVVDFRRRVEAIMEMIFRVVHVDHKLSAEDMLKATGRIKFIEPMDVASMPRGKDGLVKVYFFRPRPEAYGPSGHISDERLEEEYRFVGLVPIDPFSLIQVNVDDKDFSDERPNATHWKNADGRWCYASFGLFDRRREVAVHRKRESGFSRRWSFAGRLPE